MYAGGKTSLRLFALALEEKGVTTQRRTSVAKAETLPGGTPINSGTLGRWLKCMDQMRR